MNPRPNYDRRSMIERLTKRSRHFIQMQVVASVTSENDLALKQAANGINARVLRIQPGMDWTLRVLRRKACALPRPLGEQRWQRQLLPLESCCSVLVRI